MDRMVFFVGGVNDVISVSDEVSKKKTDPETETEKIGCRFGR